MLPTSVDERMRTIFYILGLILAGFMAPAFAQGVSIPDPGLNAAIREALQKPSGPLTEQDLLSLTGLSAQSRNIESVEGLEAARNLTLLDLNFKLGAINFTDIQANLFSPRFYRARPN